MDTRAGLGYRRLASPLHAARAWVGALWFAALIAAALIVHQPLVLASLALAILLAGTGAGVGRRLVASLRMVLIVIVPIVVVNVLVSRDGLTVFARLGDLGPFGQGDLTVEALAYGGWIALKVTIIMLATTFASLCVDPDELMRGLRRFSFRSALTASLAVRMVPLLGADARRLGEAQRTRPDGHAGLRRRALLLSAVVAGSLDRAMDVAATLEVRGLAVGGSRGTRRMRAPYSRHDVAFLVSASAIVAIALAGRAFGFDQFDAYPLIHAPVSLGTLALAAILAAAVLLPYAARRGIEL